MLLNFRSKWYARMVTTYIFLRVSTRYSDAAAIVSLFKSTIRVDTKFATTWLMFLGVLQVFYTWVVRFLAETISYWQSVESAVGLATKTPLEDPNNLHDGASNEKNPR